MPIQASLGALSYPRVVSTPFPANTGFASILSTTTGTGIKSYSEADTTTPGGSVGADSAGNMYVAGSKPPVINTTDNAYVFKLDSTDGAGIFDQNYNPVLGYGATCDSNDIATYTVSELSGGPGSATLYTTSARRLSGGSFVGITIINSGTPSSGTRAWVGNTRLGGDNRTCVAYSLESFGYIMGIAINNTTGAFTKRGLNPGGTGRTIDCVTDANGNFYLLGFAGTTAYLAKWNSAGTIQWKLQGATSLGMNSIVADTSYLYVACNDGVILKIDGSTGSIVLQYDFNGGNYITLGDDGYLYTSGNALSVMKLDTNLNAQWGWQASFGGDANSGGATIGIIQRGSHIYFGGGGTYNGRQAIFCIKTLTDGSIPQPGIWWVGTAYLRIFELIPNRTSSSKSLSTSTVATGTSGSSSSTAFSGTPGSGGYVLGNTAF